MKFSLKGIAGNKNKDEKPISPTLDALCWHFGFYDKIMFRFQHAFSTGRPLEEWEQIALRAFQRKRLETIYVKKIRKEYRKIFWFYCVPAPECLIKDSITGELFKSTVEEEEDFDVLDVFGVSNRKIFDPSLLVLSVLPVNAADAQNRFGLKRNEIEELALQVSWLVMMFVARKTMISAQEALQAIDTWRLHLPSSTFAGISDKIRRCLPA